MSTRKNFTPEQIEALKQAELLTGVSKESVRAARIGGLFRGKTDGAIHAKLYRINLERTGKVPTPKPKKEKLPDGNVSGAFTEKELAEARNSVDDTLASAVSPVSSRIPVTGYIENGYAVLTYTVRVKLPK